MSPLEVHVDDADLMIPRLDVDGLLSEPAADSRDSEQWQSHQLCKGRGRRLLLPPNFGT